MNRINIKPLSTNRLWQGRRFKTPEYKVYEQEMWYLLPDMEVPQGKLSIKFEFGLSSKNADVDNCIKGCVDILQKKYGFNDRYIYKLEAVKVDVKRGEEYIDFELSTL